MAPYIQLGAFAALIVGVFWIRRRLGAAPFSALRLTLGTIAGLWLVLSTLTLHSHRCDSGIPFQSGLIPALILGYWITRVRAHRAVLLVGAVVITTASVLLSEHWISASHSSGFTGNHRASVRNPIREEWYSAITGLYPRVPLSAPGLEIERLVEEAFGLYGTELFEPAMDELVKRPETIPQLHAQLKAAEWDTPLHDWTLEALARISDPRSETLLLEYLREQSKRGLSEIHPELIVAMGRLQSQEAGDLILEIFRQNLEVEARSRLHVAALRALGKLGDDRALPLIQDHTREPTYTHKHASSVLYFALLGSEECRTHLRHLFATTKQPTVGLALVQLGDRKPLADGRKALDEWIERYPVTSARGLSMQSLIYWSHALNIAKDPLDRQRAEHLASLLETHLQRMKPAFDSSLLLIEGKSESALIEDLERWRAKL